jgi:hypothetical protein
MEWPRSMRRCAFITYRPVPRRAEPATATDALEPHKHSCATSHILGKRRRIDLRTAQGWHDELLC